MAIWGDAEKRDDAEARDILWNGIVKGLIEGLERERELGVLRVGDLRWSNRRLRIGFGVWLGRRLTAWR